MSQEVNIDQLTKMIQEQMQSQTEKKAQARETAKRTLLTKTILMAVTGALIFSSLVYLGVAWYTRIATTHAVTFEVADYELAVNDNTENEFLVNVYDYSNVKEKTMAPGTAGYIPLRMSARHSDIDVDFSIVVKNRMSQKMQQHIRFFYLVDSTGKPVVCSLDKKGVVVPEDQDKFMSDPNKVPTGLQKRYFGVYPEETPTDFTEFTIQGTLQMNTEKVIYIYWEWYLDAEDAAEKGAVDQATITDWAEFCEEWDADDTDMGKYPKKYYESMYVHLTCIGVQSEPQLDKRD